MGPHRHLVVITLSIIAIVVSMASVERPIEALGSPVVAIALASIATAGTLWRAAPAEQPTSVRRPAAERRRSAVVSRRVSPG